jgi:hypothetical protein
MNAPAWTAALLPSSDERVAGGGLSLAPRGNRDSHAAIPSREAGEADSCAVSARRRFANADGNRPVAERKQGRAACELVVDDRCGGVGGLDAVEASAGGERRALGYFGEVLVEEHPGDEFLA